MQIKLTKKKKNTHQEMYSYHPQEKEQEQPKPENPSDCLASKVKPHQIISRI